MKELENLKELYLDEIKKINKKGELTPVDAEAAAKALEAIHKIDELCCKMEQDNMLEYSERRYPMPTPMSRRMPDVMHFDYGYDRSYDQAAMSRRRRYRADGPAETTDRMIRKLNDMLNEATDERTRMAIEQAIDKLETY